MYRVSNALRSTETKEGTIILDVLHGRLFRLNRTAYLILTYLQRGHSQARIIREISEEFHTVPEVTQKDVCDILSALERYGLVQTTSESDQ